MVCKLEENIKTKVKICKISKSGTYDAIQNIEQNLVTFSTDEFV